MISKPDIMAPHPELERFFVGGLRVHPAKTAVHAGGGVVTDVGLWLVDRLHLLCMVFCRQC